MADSIFEQCNRARKVARLVAVLDRAGATTAAVRNMGDDDWQRLAEHAGVHPPSEITRQHVVNVLALRDVDPFEGLTDEWDGAA